VRHVGGTGTGTTTIRFTCKRLHILYQAYASLEFQFQYKFKMQFRRVTAVQQSLRGLSQRVLCTTTGPTKSRWTKLKEEFKGGITFARTVRAIRVVVLSTMIYQVGYHNGMIHFAQDPTKVEEELVKFSVGLEPDENLDTRIHSKYSPVHKRVAAIGNRIIHSAKEHCENQLLTNKLNRETLKLKKELGTNRPDNGIELELLENEIEKWTEATKRLSGKWTFVVVKDKEVNAFVTGLCPRKVFVYEGLIDSLKITDDELAMILGHELSHVILGHCEEQVPTTAILLGTQLILMAFVDPTGLLSYVFDGLIAQFRGYIEASYSRQHETEADELGLVLMSLSCYDMQAGVFVHNKLAELQQHRTTQLGDSHPSSDERVGVLYGLVKHYENEHKKGVKGPFYRDCTMYKQTLRSLGVNF
jgi:hypothetical protein